MKSEGATFGHGDRNTRSLREEMSAFCMVRKMVKEDLLGM